MFFFQINARNVNSQNEKGRFDPATIRLKKEYFNAVTPLVIMF